MLDLRISICLAAALLAAGCSMRSLSVRASRPLVADIADAYRAESDVELVRAAAPGHLKMLDGLLRAAPDDPELRALACQLWAWWGFGILEDEMESAATDEARETAAGRVRDAYRRAREHGLRRLSLWKGSPSRPASQAAPTADEVALFSRSFTRADAPSLFWCALAWLGLIQLSLDQPQLLADLPAAAALAKEALRLDPAYFHGGPHLLLGVVLGARSRALGGDPDAAAKHFDEADRLAEGRFLVVPLLKARYWAVTVQDREKFEFLLRRAAAVDPGVLPEDRLSNELARRRAKRYLARTDDFF